MGFRKQSQTISLCHEHNTQHRAQSSCKFWDSFWQWIRCLSLLMDIVIIMLDPYLSGTCGTLWLVHELESPRRKLHSSCNEMNRSTLRQGGLFQRQRTEVLEDAVYSCTEYVFGHFSTKSLAAIKVWARTHWVRRFQNLIPDYTIETKICWKGANPNAWWNCQGWNHHGFAREKRCERMARLSPK